MEREKGKTSDEQNLDFVRALGLHKIFSSIVGIWPLECEDTFSKFRFITAVLFQMGMLLSLIGDTFSEGYLTNDVAALLTVVCSSILSLTKLISLRCCYRSKILAIIVTAVEDWAGVRKHSRAHDTMKRYAALGRFVLIYQMSFAYATVTLFIIGALPFSVESSLTDHQDNSTIGNTTETLVLRALPLSTNCLYCQVSSGFYAFYFVVQSIQLIITVIGNVGNDVFFFGITMHLCGQFQVLGEEIDDLFGQRIDNGEKHHSLVKLVQRQNKLYDLARNIEDSFNFIILLQLSANASQMCMMGVQMILSLKSSDAVMIILTTFTLTVLGLQLFLYSYAGDVLSSQIQNLGLSAYSSSWYDLPPALAREVLFVILRNYKTFNITAGKVYRIDIDNFKNLIKALGSYFSVLRVMFDA